ncbi:MAG TPA: Stf0 family sulfotransferase [Novosphingobium sp.]|nr:Stf0 family sulfotransferase [Novosphingobium sp.]
MSSLRRKCSTNMPAPPIDSWLTEPLPEAVAATRGYLICATPRSGSYYLCDLLRSTGVLGRPHEYFGDAALRALGRASHSAGFGDRLGMARTWGCTANGVFGAKLFPLQLAATPPGAIVAGMGHPQLIQLERADQLGQAISLTRAAISNSFFAQQQSTNEPQFDAPLIRDYLELVIRWNAAWQLWFARHGVVPLRVLYEDLVSDPQGNIDRVAAALGVTAVARIDPAKLTMVIQRDALSEEWRERFLAGQPQDRPFELPRPAAMVRLNRRVRRLLRMIGLRRD